MKNVLLVDDDPLILRIYGKELLRAGWKVAVAGDGLEAIKFLRAGRPDAIVLDLMMPRLSGADVMRFLQTQPTLSRVPVVVLSNAFMGDTAQETMGLGARKLLLKVRCTPSILIKALEEVLANPGEPPAPVAETGPKKGVVENSPQPRPERAASGPPLLPSDSRSPTGSQTRADADIRASVRHEFVSNSVTNCLSLRKLFDVFNQAGSNEGRKAALEALHRKVHLVTSGAGLADCHRIAQLGTALEALLFQLMDGVYGLTPFVQQMVGTAIDGLAVLFQQASRLEPDPPLTGKVIVLDPDTASTRLYVTALRAIPLPAHGASEVAAALKCLLEEHHDLLLVRTRLPGITGADFCRSARMLSGYADLPVIYLVQPNELEATGQARPLCDEIVVKPVLPAGLAVSVLLRLLKLSRRN